MQNLLVFGLYKNHEKHRGGLPCSQGREAPEEHNQQYKKSKRETAVSQRLINFVLYMYHQLTSEQSSQIFALLQKKTARKEIASIVGTSEATISRELKNNSTPSGKYIWTKAQDMAMQRRENGKELQTLRRIGLENQGIYYQRSVVSRANIRISAQE